MDAVSDDLGSSIVRRAPFGSNPLVGERGTDTQRRILAAALEVFAEVGFSDARVELITEKAGCSRPAFYQYFSSKDDVFWALAGGLGKAMVEVAERLERVTPDADGLARLSAWIDDFMNLHAAYAPVFAAFQAASRDAKPLARSSSGISDRTGEALLRAFGAQRSARSATLATGLVAVLIRCSFYAEAMPGALARRPLVDGLAQMLHRLFVGPVTGVNVIPRPASKRTQPAVAAPEPIAEDRPLRPRGEKTRQRLLHAGASVLPARGYHDTRVDDIVTAAGVSHGTFYRYFENKDDFFRALAEGASGRMIELLDELRPDGDIDELRAWLREWFRTYESNGGVISTWQEMQTNEEMAAFSKQVAASVLTRLVRVLETRPFGDPTVDAITFLALIERLPYSVYTLQFTSQDDAIETMITIIRRGFLALPDPG
jgi:AcrR family transcriptional regulator